MHNQLRPTGLDWRWKRKSDLPVSSVAQQYKRTRPWAWPPSGVLWQAVRLRGESWACAPRGLSSNFGLTTSHCVTLDNEGAGHRRPEVTNSLFAGLVASSPCLQFPSVISSSKMFQISTFIKIAQSFLVQQIFFFHELFKLGSWMLKITCSSPH